MCNRWAVKNSARHDAMRHVSARFESFCDNEREPEQWADNLHFISNRYIVGDFPAEWKRIGFVSSLIMRLVRVIRESSRMLHYRID